MLKNRGGEEKKIASFPMFLNGTFPFELKFSFLFKKLKQVLK